MPPGLRAGARAIVPVGSTLRFNRANAPSLCRRSDRRSRALKKRNDSRNICDQICDHFGLWDYEKLFCPDLKSGEDIFDLRGIERATGCIVVVPPDQFMANVLPLEDVSEVTAFFDEFMIAP
jgi:hypothetical protein